MKLVKHLINGEVVSMGDPTQDVYNPSTGEVSKQVEIASKTTTEKAIQAAQEAFPEWRATPPLKRARIMFRFKDLLEKNIDKIYVPGSFELIFATKNLIDKDYDAIISMGCIIKGETKHFDYVCEATTNGIMQLNLDNDIPVMFCVLTDRTLQQAIDRSGGKHGNKGVEAAIVAIKMAQLRKQAK